jgi:ABC-type lipoprotein export system ATPase subunit
LNPDVNIFFGLNGSGKTTLLRILHSALNKDHFSLIGAPFERATVKVFFTRRDGRAFLMSRSFHMPPDDELEAWYRRMPTSVRRELARGGSPAYMPTSMALPEEHQWVTDYEAVDGLQTGEKILTTPSRMRIDLTHRYLPTSRLSEAQDAPIYDRGESSFDEYFAASIQQLWSSYSADVLGAVRQAQEDGLARILEGVISSQTSRPAMARELDPEQALNRVESFLRRRGSRHLFEREAFEDRFGSDPAFKRVVLDIDEIEQRIELALEPRTRLEKLVSRLISGPKQIRFENSTIAALATSGKKIPLGRLSSGEKQLLRILVEALSAGGNPIIIDEPELSMHIDWQQVLIESIQTIDERSQIITATHSPEIMAEIPDEKIFRL